MTGHHAPPLLIDKTGPAPLPPHIIARPRVLAYLAYAPQRRVTALIAGAGFGKTTALTTWSQSDARDEHCAWYTVTAEDADAVTLGRGLIASLSGCAPGLLNALGPALRGAHGPQARGDDVVDALVPSLAASLHRGLSSDVVLLLDGLDELDAASPGMRLVADLCHMAPSRLHLVLASRADLPFPLARLRLHGQVQVLTADSLRFDEDELRRLLKGLADGDDGGGERASAVMALTGGWPAAARLVAERLATTTDPDGLLTELRSRGGAADLVDDLLGAEAATAPGELKVLLAKGSALFAFNDELLAALGVHDALSALTAARRRGIHTRPTGRDGWVTLTPMSRQYALSRLTTPEQVEQTRLAAARWHLVQGEEPEALRYLSLTSDRRALSALLEARGSALLAAGHVSLVVQALGHLGSGDRTPGIDLVEGEACQVRGDWVRAAQCLSRLVPDHGPAPAAAAWRLGLIHHMRGEPERALELYRRGLADATGGHRDRALAAAWGSAAAWLMGDEASSRDLVAAAEQLADPSDSQVLAATQTARAMLAALGGDRPGNEMHYARALEHAERAGDLLQVIRIRTNRGSRCIEEGDYVEALAELDAAIAPAEIAGYATLHAIALSNRGEAARLLGRLDDAQRDLRAALGIQQRIGSRLAGYALTCLGAVQLDQGNRTLARASYEEALALAEPSGDLQGLVPALAGLARAVAPDEPEYAEELIARACARGASLSHTAVLLAAGWIALGRGQADAAADHARAASAAARSRRDRAGVAEALEIQAAAEPDPDRRRTYLLEARATWESLGNPLALLRTRTALAGQPAPELAIRTLGGFRLLRHGEVVATTAWQSRKARDLLKILVARRGVPIPRDQACELLWPGIDRAGNRLSVAISTVRLVLDPDHAYASDRYVASGEGAVWLRPDHVEVDLEVFLRTAADSLARDDLAGLAVAAEAYTGDFCAEDRYTDWADPVREQARSVFVSVAGTLARHDADQGRHDRVIRVLHRVLAFEPYDEGAHLAIVRSLDASGRRGDARRMYRAYVGRMAELDLEPAPYPG